MTKILALTATGFLVGCSTNPAGQQAETADLVCAREDKTGSLFPRTVCRSQRSIEQDRQAAKEEMDRVRQGRTDADPTKGR